MDFFLFRCIILRVLVLVGDLEVEGYWESEVFGLIEIGVFFFLYKFLGSGGRENFERFIFRLD